MKLFKTVFVSTNTTDSFILTVTFLTLIPFLVTLQCKKLKFYQNKFIIILIVSL